MEEEQEMVRYTLLIVLLMELICIRFTISLTMKGVWLELEKSSCNRSSGLGSVPQLQWD